MELNNKIVWLEFIKTYKSCPCLWKFRHPDYMNRIERDKAYKRLLEIAREYNPKADIGYVTTKINSIRTSFRREYKKVLLSKKSSTNEEDWYKPSLWYYEMMLFTVQNNPNRSTTYSSPESDHADESNVHESEKDHSYTEEVPDTKEIQFETSLVDGKPSRKRLRTLKLSPVQSDISHMSVENLDVEMDEEHDQLGDEFLTVGKRLAYQLKELNNDQRNCAERIFADVIFYGKLGRLTEFSTLRVASLLKPIRPNISENTAYRLNMNKNDSQSNPVMKN